MDILFLLVPLSVLLALAIMAVLAWAVWSGQFEDMEREGQRIFQEDELLQKTKDLQHDTKA
jgi:cbb3-type cytochrome oxidase maturation protein